MLIPMKEDNHEPRSVTILRHVAFFVGFVDVGVGVRGRRDADLSRAGTGSAGAVDPVLRGRAAQAVYAKE